jgi:geranylgeranyl pyrophosphate synthase
MPQGKRILEVSAESSRILLKDAIQYALSVEGSGFRERLSLAAAAASGLPTRDGAAIAKALEYFHHASLILDDLPSMDDAAERRGQPTVHLVYGESRAQLTALALINRAYITCWQTACQYPERASAAARLVSSTVGEYGILDGQDRDLHYTSSFGTKEVSRIAVLKTGCLLKLVLLLPAVLGGASVSELLALGRLARAWGRLYQGIDDFKDLLLGGLGTGKTPYRDLAHNRPNLVHALGPEAAAMELQELLGEADAHIESACGQNSAWDCLRAYQAEFRSRAEILGEAVQAA